MKGAVRPRRTIETSLSSAGGRGRIRIGGLFLLLLLAAMIYLGSQAVSGYLDYLALRETVRLTVSEIAMAPHRVEEGNLRILAKARELRLSLPEERVLIVDGEKVLARVRWQRPIGLQGWYTFPLTFEIEESRSLR
jgi:hypothetical protein